MVMNRRVQELALIGTVILSATIYAADPAANPPIAQKSKVSQEIRPVTGQTNNLTLEQRKYQEANQKWRQEQNPLFEKQRAVRKELEQAVQAENVDEKVIREKAAQLGQIEGDLAVLRAKHYKEVRAFMPRNSTNNMQFQQRLNSVVSRAGATNASGASNPAATPATPR